MFFSNRQYILQYYTFLLCMINNYFFLQLNSILPKEGILFNAYLESEVSNWWLSVRYFQKSINRFILETLDRSPKNPSILYLHLNLHLLKLCEHCYYFDNEYAYINFDKMNHCTYLLTFCQTSKKKRYYKNNK